MNYNINLCAKLLKRNSSTNLFSVHKSFFGTSEACFSKNREGKFFNKLMGKSSKKRKYWMPDVSPSSGVLLGVAKSAVGKQHLQRMRCLNTVFMEHITDLMSASETFQNVLKFNISVNEVEIAPDLNFLKVYYSTSQPETVVVLQALLDELAFPLRHELSALNIIGSVPRIVFIQDTRNQYLTDIDKLLKAADYGEDFVPTNPTLFVDRVLPSSSVSNKEGCEKCEDTDSGGTVEEGAEEMRLQTLQQLEVDKLMSLQKHEVFGLNHQSIMNRICVSVQKAKAPHRKNTVYGEVVREATVEEDSAAITERINALKSTELKEFLAKRKKAILSEQRLMERVANKPPEHGIYEAESEDRLRDEFAEDSSNFDYHHHNDELR